VIVTVTLNPSLHVRYQAERIAWGAHNQVSQVSYRAGGRGLAVARVLHMFGHDVVAAGLAGGTAGELLRYDLAASGVATEFTRIGMDSRRVVEIADSSDQSTTSLNEPAPYITTEELGRLAADYRSLMDGATAAVLCGSLPAGLPPETYGTLATYAAEAGVPAILDAGGTALMHAVTRRPALVIPEPADGDEPDPDPAVLVAAGAGAVAVLSDGGVRAMTADGQWLAYLDDVSFQAASRDALVAGLIPGIAFGWSWPDILRHAVALTAAALPADQVDLGAYEALLPEVRVDELPGPIR
jgi:tagatose 6-phosphate kinase